MLEQLWSSALWEDLRDNPGEIHRTDQCQFNAKDEMDNPVLKPTGLQSSLVLKHSLKRCKGHGGKRHGWLQGAFQRMNRTTMAAVYPEAMCKAIIKDVKNFIKHKTILHENFYKCEKCAMGRAATADMEHSFIPGECRHGKWPAGENPREKKDLRKRKDKRRTSLRTSETKLSRTLEFLRARCRFTLTLPSTTSRCQCLR